MVRQNVRTVSSKRYFELRPLVLELWLIPTQRGIRHQQLGAFFNPAHTVLLEWLTASTYAYPLRVWILYKGGEGLAREKNRSGSCS